MLMRLLNKPPFLSTPSGWRATFAARKDSALEIAISIHALRVEGDPVEPLHIFEVAISIHALRVEGDRLSRTLTRGQCSNFYPRPPGGGRLRYVHDAPGKCSFLSTPSGWRATTFAVRVSTCPEISIHALRVEGDSSCHRSMAQDNNFYPRPPGGGRLFWVSGISTETHDFYPRPPGGGRQYLRLKSSAFQVFLSTPSGWRAT